MGARRVGERLAWMGVAASGAVAATQLARRTPTPMVAIGQALTPVLVVAAPAAATIGLLRRRPALVLTAATSTAVLAATVAPAMRRPPEHAAIRTEADVLPMTIAHANMLYMNHRHARQAAAAVAANDADVLALSEITPRQARELDDLAGDRYEHRFSRPAVDSHGLALWSKLPLDDVTIQPMIRRPGIVATIVAPFGRVRIVFAHPDPPTKWRWFRQWEPSLEMIDELGSSPGDPTIIVADLNATRWHPGLRRATWQGRSR